MIETDVLIIGGGPAGVATATELAALGLQVTLVEQRDRLGGAIHRAFVGPGQHLGAVPGRHRRNWASLLQKLDAAGDLINLRLQSVFLGVDGDGFFLLDDRVAGRVFGVRPKAVVLAIGTNELVMPRPGWELPGVSTAGGMQVQLKETGVAPQGPILVAGTGPLLLALAAQLTAAGSPPIAVLERGQPFQASKGNLSAAFNGLRSLSHVSEAMGYAMRLARAGVPYRTGWSIRSIEPAADGVYVSARHVDGTLMHHQVRHLALHDGLASNRSGMPSDQLAGVYLVRAGDCREILGADAAIGDGRRAARLVANHLGHPSNETAFDSQLAAARRTQGAMAALFAPPAMPSTVPDTVLCRCEGLRRSDLDALQGASSAREMRLVGRFGMGLCQGRFCANAVSKIAAEAGIDFEPRELSGATQRWPLRPVSVAALAAYEERKEGS